jgi:hypothetical protein
VTEITPAGWLSYGERFRFVKAAAALTAATE